jgi:hypothetical protein
LHSDHTVAGAAEVPAQAVSHGGVTLHLEAADIEPSEASVTSLRLGLSYI